MNPSVWSAVFAGVSAFAATGTAVVAVWALIGTKKDSRDRTRPVMVASIRRASYLSPSITYLTIENAGRSVARHVSVTFDPPPIPDSNGVTELIIRRYARAIPVVAPGGKMSNVYSYPEHPGVHNQITLRIAYCDDRSRAYEDCFVLDHQVVVGESFSSKSGKNYDERTAKALEAIAVQLWD